MHQTGDGVQFTHPPGVALLDVNVPEKSSLSLVPEYHRLIPYPLISSNDHPALAAGHDLCGIERKRPGHTERARVPAVMARTVRMGRVLDQQNAAFVTQRPDVVDFRSDHPSDVHQDHRTCAWRERVSYCSRAQGERPGVHIRKNQIRAGTQDREAGRRKRVRRHDDVRVRHIHGTKDDLKSCGAATDRYREWNIMSRGELGFELLRMRAERQRSASQDLRSQRRNLRAIGFGKDDPRRWNLHLHTPFAPPHLAVRNCRRSGHGAARRYRFTYLKTVRIILPTATSMITFWDAGLRGGERADNDRRDPDLHLRRG